VKGSSHTKVCAGSLKRDGMGSLGEMTKRDYYEKEYGQNRTREREDTSVYWVGPFVPTGAEKNKVCPLENPCSRNKGKWFRSCAKKQKDKVQRTAKL